MKMHSAVCHGQVVTPLKFNPFASSHSFDPLNMRGDVPK